MIKTILVLFVFAGAQTLSVDDFALNRDGKNIEWWKKQTLIEEETYPGWIVFQFLKPYIIIAYGDERGYRDGWPKMAVKCRSNFWKENYRGVELGDALPDGKYRPIGFFKFKTSEGILLELPAIKPME
jgi:hypothetical protein